MKRILALVATGLIGVPAAVLVAGLTYAAVASSIDAAPVYPVATVAEGLARDPAAWLGRTLRVRGVARRACQGCAAGGRWPGPGAVRWVLTGGAPPAAAPRQLPLALRPADPLLATLRRVLLLRAVVPVPQRLVAGGVAVYRIAIDPAGSAAEGRAPCYRAQLLDAAAGP